MFPHRGQLVLLPPNRVWRTYRGGRLLDRLAGLPNPADSSWPEDWVASTTEAINPERRGEREGISIVDVGGERHAWPDLLAKDPVYFLGTAHVERYGSDPRLLVKLLDPGTRLHFQVHPTAAFARERLGASSGKTEAYHILALREAPAEDPDETGLFLGFHTPPSRETLRRWIETQDLTAIRNAMNRVDLQPGDTFVVPGGVPHAIGAGVLLVEVQEPSDFVVRFEYERGGYTLPESARFMDHGLDLALEVFDLSPWPPARVRHEAGCPPRRRRALGPDSYQDTLIGPERTPCFRVRKSHLRGDVTRHDREPYIGILTAGACTITTPAGSHRLSTCEKFFLPAGLGPVAFVPQPTAEILECYPPAP